MNADTQGKLFCREYFNFSSYVHKKRWLSYYHQIEDVLSLVEIKGGTSCLIIGGGDRIIETVLRASGLDILTFDISEALEPDYIGNVVNIEKIVGSLKVDFILCCQVLEHIEYKHFNTILKQFSRIAKQGIVLSLPWNNKTLLQIKLRLGKTVFIKKDIIISSNIKDFKAPQEERQHHWEVGMRDYPLSKIRNQIKKYFVLKNEYIDFSNPYHRFYTLLSVKNEIYDKKQKDIKNGD